MFNYLTQNYGWVWASYLAVLAIILGFACAIIAELKQEVRELQKQQPTDPAENWPDEYFII
jgi:hypothetical protein